MASNFSANQVSGTESIYFQVDRPSQVHFAKKPFIFLCFFLPFIERKFKSLVDYSQIVPFEWFKAKTKKKSNSTLILSCDFRSCLFSVKWINICTLRFKRNKRNNFMRCRIPISVSSAWKVCSLPERKSFLPNFHQLQKPWTENIKKRNNIDKKNRQKPAWHLLNKRLFSERKLRDVRAKLIRDLLMLKSSKFVFFSGRKKEWKTNLFG